MPKDIKKDHLIESFLDSLYIEKGLSQNTVQSYKNDITSFALWVDESINLPLVRISKIDIYNVHSINQYVSYSTFNRF